MKINSLPINKKPLFDDQDELPVMNSSLQSSAKKEQPVHQDEQSHLFRDYELDSRVIAALDGIGYTSPTKIQSQTLKHSLKDGDMACLSETGSGKTLSFLLPIVNYLVKEFQERPLPGIALVLAPTRQLCIQIQDYLIKFQGEGISQCSSMVMHGGADTKMKQILELTKKPAVIVGTPGRILDHLQNTKGFNLNNLKYLVFDEADKLLNLDFEKQINDILAIIPKNRNTYLYSATLTSKVEKLQRVSLNDPVRIEVNLKYKTVSKLSQFYVFIPSKWKDCYLLYLLNRYKTSRTIIFTKTCLGAERLFLVLRELKLNADCLHGDLSQPQRLKALSNFKQRKCRILVCTDVAARGIDISDIDLVMNYDLCPAKDYVHRVGRTARIGKEGMAISLVSQYDVQIFQEIEKKTGKQIPQLKTQENEALVFLQLLDKCHQEVSRKMRKGKKQKH